MKYKDKGLVVLGMNANEKNVALDVLRANGATFANVIDSSEPTRKIWNEDYDTGNIPMSYIIDADGKIVAAWSDYHEGEPDVMAALQKVEGPLGETVRRECNARAVASAVAVTAVTTRLFEAMRTADYDRHWLRTADWQSFPAADVVYLAGKSQAGWVRSVCRKFKENPIVDVQLGEVFAGPTSLPTVHFELHLKDGEVLAGDLPFNWDAEKKQWVGWHGLDWHVQ
jgi:hypothetical protein